MSLEFYFKPLTTLWSLTNSNVSKPVATYDPLEASLQGPGTLFHRARAPSDNLLKVTQLGKSRAGIGNQVSGSQYSLMPLLPLIPHQRSRLHLLKGKIGGLRLPGTPVGGFELYLHVLHMCAYSTQREIWDGSSLGASGPPVCWEIRPELAGPQQCCPGPALSLT